MIENVQSTNHKQSIQNNTAAPDISFAAIIFFTLKYKKDYFSG
jgi:hypothetical protein